MATQLAEPLFPINQVIRHYLQQTMQAFEINAMTQAVYPNEVYPGYTEVNAARRAAGRWYSTGDGEKSFRGRIVSCNENGDITLAFGFLDYMRYAELGVGAGEKAGSVDRARKANFGRRYVSVWDRSQGRSHRPFIMMEIRHLQTRIEKYMQNYYGMDFQMKMMETFNGLTIDVSL